MYPPQQIQPGASIQFASESQGFMTGTEGNTLYTAIVLADTTKNGSIALHWDNPYVGSNA